MLSVGMLSTPEADNFCTGLFLRAHPLLAVACGCMSTLIACGGISTLVACGGMFPCVGLPEPSATLLWHNGAGCLWSPMHLV